MKTKEQIQERVNKLKKLLAQTAKHHDKYVELYHKACDSWSCKDFSGARICKYKRKYIELYEVWKEMTYYKKGLEWVLKECEEENAEQV